MDRTYPVSIKIVSSKKDLKEFIYLPEKIHKGHANWLPPIYLDEWNFFNKEKNLSFKNANTIMLLAYRGSSPVGRIMGIIHNAYNMLHDEQTARFCFFDCYDDVEAAHALIEHVETWAGDMGMNKVIGPFGFSDKDPQGFLIEGFEHMPVLDSACNFPYMVDFLTAKDYAKKVDCVVYKLYLSQELPLIYQRIKQRVELNKEYRFIHFKSRRELKPYVVPVLELVNETYQELYGFYPMEHSEMVNFANRYLPLLDPRFVKMVKAGEEIVGFVIGVPNFTRGIQKAKGRLFPFGFLHILNSMRNSLQLDLMLGAIKESHRGRGLDVAMAVQLVNACKDAGMTCIEIHLVLETNKRMFAELEHAGCQFHKRFRIFQKDL